MRVLILWVLTKRSSPLSPAHMDWSSHYPAFVNPDPEKTNLAGARKLLKDVEVVDIGCGFGGLLVGLAPLLPETLMLGMPMDPVNSFIPPCSPFQFLH